MKKLILLAVTITCLSGPAFAKPMITVRCQCSFNSDFILQTVLVAGTHRNPSEGDLQECIILHGEVISGCFAALMNASYNCQEQVLRLSSSSDFRIPAVKIKKETCKGQISED